MKLIDLTGQQFGDLTVIGRGPNTPGGQTQWVCRCKCGNEILKASGDLRHNGRPTPSCCPQCLRKRNTKDLTGQRFGRLIVKELSLNNKYKSFGAHWICQCDCGNTTTVFSSDLLSGKTQSCGCYRNEQISLRRTSKINIGDRFNKLTVIGYEGNTNGCSYWKCKCDCGNEIIVKGYLLTGGHYQSCGCLVSKGEGLITNFLQKLEIPYKSEYSFQDLVSDKNARLRFDFAIFNEQNELLGLIEFDGPQHFKDQLKQYNILDFDYERLHTHDLLKDEYCKNHNIPLIRFSYKELKANILTLDYFINKIPFINSDSNAKVPTSDGRRN